MGVSQLYRIKIDIVGAFDLWVLTTVNDIIANLEIVGYPDFMGLHNEGLYQPKGDIVGAFDLWMLTTRPIWTDVGVLDL